MITKNEEKNLRELLENISWAEEIVIVDDFSNDRSKEICAKYPQVYFTQNKMEGFGPQKNVALNRAKGEWILFLDADERIDEGLKEEIFRKINEDEYDGYYVRRNNFFFDTWIKDHKPLKLFLFKKAKGCCTDKMVHEEITVNGKIGDLEGSLTHLAKSHKNLTNYIDIYVNRYSSLTAVDFHKMQRAVTWRNVGVIFCIKPFAIFLQKFFIKKGFKLGWRGFLLASLSAIAYFVSYAKLLENQEWRLK